MTGKIEDFEERFLAYARTRDPDEVFGFHDTETCALGQFVRSVDPSIRPNGASYSSGQRSFAYPSRLFEAAWMCGEETGIRTWGKLIRKLEQHP
jgi:hypothetical protein